MSVSTERLEQTLEEVVELASGICFLVAVLLRHVRELSRWQPPGSPVSPASAG